MSRIGRSDTPARIAIRHLVPACSVLAATVLMMAPLPLAWGVMPDFALLLLIVWARIQPRLLPPWAALLLGLFADATLGLPFGVLATLYPLVVVLARLGEARLESHDLLIDWGFAAMLLFLGYLLAFELLGFAGRAPALAPMLAQAGLSALAYPLVTAVAARLQRWLVGAEG